VDRPIVAGTAPARVELEAGETRTWCACGHDDLSGLERRDLTTWKREMAELFH
jgi:hypothetical protein